MGSRAKGPDVGSSERAFTKPCSDRRGVRVDRFGPILLLRRRRARPIGTVATRWDCYICSRPQKATQALRHIRLPALFARTNSSVGLMIVRLGPFRPENRHDEFVAIDAIEIYAASRNPLYLKANAFVGAARAQVFWEKSEGKAIGLGLTENGAEQGAQERLPETLARPRYGEAFDVADLFDRGPITKNCKPYRLVFELTEKIGETRVAQRGVMPAFVGAPDQMFITFHALGRHDEGDVGDGGPYQSDGRNIQFRFPVPLGALAKTAINPA
jgi:hypothetical protein